jgi:hypothetical protein
MKEGDYLGDLYVHGRIILKWIFRITDFEYNKSTKYKQHSLARSLTHSLHGAGYYLKS